MKSDLLWWESFAEVLEWSGILPADRGDQELVAFIADASGTWGLVNGTGPGSHGVGEWSIRERQLPL